MNKEIMVRNFSRYAHLYDDHANIQQQVAKELLAKIKDESFENILEVGSGTGGYSSLLRKHFRSAKIQAFDISRKMVEFSREKLKGENINFFEADAENLKLAEEFDLVTSNACFHWFLDLERAISSCVQLLRKNGTIAFSIFGPLTFTELGQSLQSVFNQAHIAANDFSGQENIEIILRKHFHSLSIKEIRYQEKYNNLQDLLSKIKFTGTAGDGLTNKVNFSRGVLKQLETAYLHKFKSIFATYQVFFCQGKA